MKRVLIVAPHFPPVSAADGHRARMMVSHLSAFGWEPIVLTVDAARQPEISEPELTETLPPGLRVIRVGALPLALSRLAGIGNVALRAWPQLYRGGARAIREYDVDLVYFSTTMFAAMPLGRVWKRMLGVPYVLDMQDPWSSGVHAARRGFKGRVALAMHAVLEAFTMRQVDGLISVSPAYLEALQLQYPWIRSEMCRTVPFGAAIDDHLAAASRPWHNPLFTPASDGPHGVALGRGGEDMRTAAAILFRACRLLRQADAEAPGPRLWFVGTDYAPAGTGRQTIAPVAADEGLAEAVHEQPDRIAYFDGLRLLAEADFLVVLGSTDAQYSPSKVYPYLLSRRPVVAVLHQSSPVVGLLRRAACGPLVTFAGPGDVDAAAAALMPQLRDLLHRLPASVTLDESLHRTFSARMLTGQQCELFDRVAAATATRAAVVPCQG